MTTPLNYRYTPPEIDHALDGERRQHHPRPCRACEPISPRARRVACRSASSLYGTRTATGSSFEALVKAEPPTVTLPAPEPDAPVAIFFTSGSTGPAKGVTHTFDSLGWMFASVAKGYAADPGRCHAAGVVLLPCRRVFLLDGRALDWRRELPWREPSTMLSSGRSYAPPARPSCRRCPRRCCISSASPTRPPTISARSGCARSGGDKVPCRAGEGVQGADRVTEIHEGYGMTEIGIAANNPPTGLDKLGSIGLPNPGFVFSIRTEQGRRDGRRPGRPRVHQRAEPHVRLLERPRRRPPKWFATAGSIPATS